MRTKKKMENESKTSSLEERLNTKKVGLVYHINHAYRGRDDWRPILDWYSLVSDLTKLSELKKDPYDIKYLGMTEVLPEVYKKIVKNNGTLEIEEKELAKCKLDLAQHYATVLHQGQFRLGTNEQFIVHPIQVVKNIKNYSYRMTAPMQNFTNTVRGILYQQKTDLTIIQCNRTESDFQAIGWLHDTIEETELTYERLKSTFGKNIADAVNILTRNVGRDKYKKRLSEADADIKMIKLCDVLHNTTTLHCLPEESAQRYIADCRSFYIPLAENIFIPEIAVELQKNIIKYLLSKK